MDVKEEELFVIGEEVPDKEEDDDEKIDPCVNRLEGICRDAVAEGVVEGETDKERKGSWVKGSS